jgi:hypothetical protein
MISRPIKIPGADHPITITLTTGQVTVVNGNRIADGRGAISSASERVGVSFSPLARHKS